MKRKLYLTFFSAILALPLLAQPTLTTADLPVAGLAFTMVQDSTYNAPIPSGGANVTWDYSGLQNLLIDTIGFGAAAGTPYAGSFPTSNLASQADNLTDWTYTTSNNSGFYIDGVATPTLTIRYTPPALFAPVPFTYNQTRTNIARIVQDTVIIDTTGTPRNVRFIQNQRGDFLADGYGTLILPNGSFNNILRMKNTELTTDSLLVELLPGTWTLITSSASQTTFYRYFEAGSPSSYILGIEADSLGVNAVNSEYRGQWVLLNTPALTKDEELSVYPNPAHDLLTIQGAGLKQRSSLTITDASGRIILERLAVSAERATIPVDALSNGMYYLIVQGETGSSRIPILIQH